MTGNYMPDVVDGNVTAWEAFTASLDVEKLQRERMRSGDLDGERFGSGEHRELQWTHEVRRVESRRVLLSRFVPFVFIDAHLPMVERLPLIVTGLEAAATGPLLPLSGDETVAAGKPLPGTPKPSQRLTASKGGHQFTDVQLAIAAKVANNARTGGKQDAA